VGPDVEAMRWRGPTPELAAMSDRLNAAGVLKRYEAVASR
jgi:hypothetical protein